MSEKDDSSEISIPSLSVNCSLGFDNLLLILQYAGLKIQPIGDSVFESLWKALQDKDDESLLWFSKLLEFIPFQNSRKQCILRGGEIAPTIDWLVENGLRIAHIDHSCGLTPFHACCAGGCVQAAWTYVDRGQDLSIKESRGWTPLHYAASYGHVEIVHMLCEQNANINAVDSRGYNALQTMLEDDFMATHKGRLDIVQELLRYGSRIVTTKRPAPAEPLEPDIDHFHHDRPKATKPPSPRCAIEIACRKNYPDILQIFIDAQLVLGDYLVPFPVSSPRPRTPLMTSVYYNSRECVKLLLGCKADVHKVVHKRTAISLACSKNHLDVLQLLLDAGGGPSHHGLKFAIRHGSLQSIKMLTKHPEFQKLRRSSLVQYACKDKRFDIAWLLMNAETDRDVEQECLQLGRTCRETHFIHLVYKQFPSKVKQFIAGCCQDLSASKFWFGAAEHGPLEFIQHVFDNLDIDVNMQNRIGNTALHTACLANHVDIVFFLLKNGADPDIENKQGRIAEELCSLIPELKQVFRGLSDVYETFRRQSNWTNSLMINPDQLFESNVTCFGEVATLERTYTSVTSPKVWSVSSVESRESILVLAKDDDLRMEMFAMKIREFLNSILTDVHYGNMPVQMVTYDIIPRGRRGLVEFVENCISLSKIKDDAIVKGEPAADALIDYFAVLTDYDKLKHEEMVQAFEMSVCVEMAFVYFMGMGDNHGGNWLLREDGRHFRIDYSYFFGNKPKGSTAPIPTTFNHVLQLCRPHWDAFILPKAVSIIKTWLRVKDEILFYAQGLLIGLEMDATVWTRMCNWTNSLSAKEFALRMNKDGICKGRLLKSVQHARHTSLRQVLTRLFFD